MEYEKGIDESVDAPAVPEKIRAALYRNMHGLCAVIVEEETQQGRFKKLNRLKLDNKAGDFPDEDAETICEGVMRVLDFRDKQREEGDAPINFRVVFERKGKDGKRTRPSVEYTYVPDGGPDDDAIEDYLGDPRLQILEEQREYISRLHFHLDEAHTMIREIANNNQQSIKPIMDALGWMGHFYAMGLQNQQVALSMIYDIKKVEVQEHHANARTERWIETLKKPLTVAFGQFAQYVGKKFNKATGTQPEADDEEDDTPKSKPAQDSPSSSNVDDDLTDEQKANPIAAYAQACGLQIRPDQWFSMTDVLSKRELGLLRSVLLAMTDESCAEAYDEFAELPVSKLMKLNEILDDEQRQMLKQLGELVKVAKEAQRNEKN